ncbi:GDYXXLXY domain-containing protein [Nocardioides sp. InS609-2]|uniref:GDYXXLXY domain-containing protein n=1 Tax=Nocardioides sp. InS609-2 TaxID=2760705 RepID=UPI0020BF0565|nr:GDYXXLXY domain-containing protein [Nocardioides sp. InS609-2]
MIRTIALVAAVQLAATGLAVAPQLSARVAGDEIQLRVEPLDPIDPFRGAYVALDYPDLRLDREMTGEHGDVYISLVDDGSTMKAGGWSRTRPEDGTYLTCSDRDWQVECGIESWFVPQDKAHALEDAVRDGDVVATVKVDSRGHAAIVAVAADS